MPFNPYVWLATAIVALSLFGSGYYKGYEARKKHDTIVQNREKAEQKIAEEKALADRIEENRKIEAKRIAEKSKIIADYEHEIAKIRSFKSTPLRVRITEADCKGFTGSSEAKSANGSDATVTRTITLPESVEADLWNLVKEADAAVEIGRAAQKSLTDNEMAP